MLWPLFLAIFTNFLQKNRRFFLGKQCRDHLFSFLKGFNSSRNRQFFLQFFSVKIFLRWKHRGPILGFFKYFSQKNWRKNWRFLAQSTTSFFAKICSQHCFLRKTPIFLPKIVKKSQNIALIASTPCSRWCCKLAWTPRGRKKTCKQKKGGEIWTSFPALSKQRKKDTFSFFLEDKQKTFTGAWKRNA
jgi:hypothetical protein